MGENIVQESHSSQPIRQHSFIRGEDVSITISKNHDSSICFLQAHIVNNFLFVCQRSKLTGDHSLTVYQSSMKVNFGACKVPLFPEPFVAIYRLSAARFSSPSDDVFGYRPAVLFVGVSHSNNNSQYDYDAVLEPDIFSKLFGSELTLSGSPVLVYGCQNGQVVYLSVPSATIYLSSSQQPLPIIYSLGQPVQSIHAVCLPENDTLLTKKFSCVPNALIVIGSLGKIVVCTTGAYQQRLPSFLEFYVPGPITSSILVKKCSLLFTSSLAIYRVCLKEDCIRKHCAVVDSNEVVIVPELRFRLPSVVAKCDRGTLLLHDVRIDSMGSESGFKVACVSLNGAMTQIIIGDCCGKNTIDRGDESELTMKLKKCLQSLEATNCRLDELRKMKEQQNVCLAELSRELSIVGDVARARCGTAQLNSDFRVSYCPKYENVGAIYHKPCIDLCLTYTGPTPVSKGWSLLVQTFQITTKSGSKCVTYSQLVPLTNLQPKNKVHTQIVLEDFDILCHKICCYLRYDASHLVRNVTSPTTITILLSQKLLDLIDFLLPLKHQPRQVAWRPLCLTTQQTDNEEEFSHYKNIKLSVAKVMTAYGKNISVANLSREFLGATLVRKELVEIISETEENTNEVTTNSYDGSKVYLETSVEAEALVVSVYSTSEITLCEAVDSIQSRTNSNN